jgi:hypothetical protein
MLWAIFFGAQTPSIVHQLARAEAKTTLTATRSNSVLTNSSSMENSPIKIDIYYELAQGIMRGKSAMTSDQRRFSAQFQSHMWNNRVK